MKTAKKKQMKTVKLIGGPLDGKMIEIERSAEEFKVGRGVPFFTYRYAGRPEGQEHFALWPRKRVLQRMISSYIRITGKHPAIEFNSQKQTPYRKRSA